MPRSCGAAMEAEAFVSKDVDHLLDTGLKFVPADSAIAELIRDIRVWAREDGDWMATRQRIEDVYGYDKFGGVCHVIPNHGIMVLALLYGGHSFHEAMHIVNTCGVGIPDCNSGNVGCLVAIMHGLSAFEGGPDWRGPLADRALISSADGGYSINNAARIALDIANLGRCLAGQSPTKPPKDNAQFHFTLPGSVPGLPGVQRWPHFRSGQARAGSRWRPLSRTCYSPFEVEEDCRACGRDDPDVHACKRRRNGVFLLVDGLASGVSRPDCAAYSPCRHSQHGRGQRAAEAESIHAPRQACASRRPVGQPAPGRQTCQDMEHTGHDG